MRTHPPIGTHKELDVMIQAQRYYSERTPEEVLEILSSNAYNDYNGCPWNIYCQYSLSEEEEPYIDFEAQPEIPVNFRPHGAECKCQCHFSSGAIERYQDADPPVPLNYPSEILELIMKVNRNLFVTQPLDKYGMSKVARISAPCCRQIFGLSKSIINCDWKFYRYLRESASPLEGLHVPTAQEIGWL
jgi:hypothetical protein